MAEGKIIEPVQPGAAEEWDGYLQRFGFSVEAKGITNNARKKALFLSCCGTETCELAHGLIAPTTLEQATLKEITDQLTKHLLPMATTTKRRLDFHKRGKKEQKS